MNEVFSPWQEDFKHAEMILDAYDWYTSAAGRNRGAAMLGDEMIDEASRKAVLDISATGARGRVDAHGCLGSAGALISPSLS